MREVVNHGLALTGTALGGALTGYLVAGNAEGAQKGALVHLGFLGVVAGASGAAGGAAAITPLRVLYLLGGVAILGTLGYRMLRRSK